MYMKMEDIENNRNNSNTASDEWVITKNEKGSVKTATCEENETGIYDKTRDWVVTEWKNPVYKKCNTNKMIPKNVAKLFIRDLLSANEEEGCFIYKNISFVTVFICGQVIDKYASSEYYFIDVDDGTSTIKCLLSIGYLAHLKESNSGPENCTDWLEENDDKNSSLRRACRVIKSSLDHIHRSVPDFHEIELGDTVTIMGTLRQYTHGRNIFIKKINRHLNNPIFFSSHLEQMVYLYREVYSQM